MKETKALLIVLTREAPAAPAGDRLAFIAEGAAADLPGLMARIRDAGMTLVALHDRPQKTELGRYRYLIECAGGSREGYEKLTAGSPFAFRYLGCFDLR